MNKIEMIQEIKEIQENIEAMKNAISDLRSGYVRSTSITIHYNESTLYNKSYNGDYIDINDVVLINFMKKQVDDLTEKLKNKVENYFKEL